MCEYNLNFDALYCVRIILCVCHVVSESCCVCVSTGVGHVVCVCPLVWVMLCMCVH